MRVTLRLPDELHQRLQREAQQAGASLNQTIVATLDRGLHGAPDQVCARGSLPEYVARIRAALGDLTVEVDDGDFPAARRIGDQLPDRTAFRETLPTLDPPLSATIIAEREDRL
jgi:hypothetical protein